MKLRSLYEQLLTEIGDTANIPPGAKFDLSQHKGKVKFDFLGDEYSIEIRLLINSVDFEENDIKIALGIDFWTGEDNSNMTNRHQALKLMSYIVGSIEEYLIRLQKQSPKGQPLKILYIKFNPKSEDKEVQDFDTIPKDQEINVRDRLYRSYIEKFAKKYGSKATFITLGGVISKFNPPLEIK